MAARSRRRGDRRRVEDVEMAVGRELRMERQAEEAFLGEVADQDAGGQVEKQLFDRRRCKAGHDLNATGFFQYEQAIGFTGSGSQAERLVEGETGERVLCAEAEYGVLWERQCRIGHPRYLGRNLRRRHQGQAGQDTA